MPYTSTNELPAHVQKYSPTMQRMWLNVYNSTYSKVLKETNSTIETERRATLSANSVVKARAETFGTERYGHGTVFLIKMDTFLQNLEG